MSTEAISKKLQRLIIDLRDATVTRKISWQETAEEGTFRVVLRHGLVRISYDDEDTEETYVIELMDQENRLVEMLALTSHSGTIYQVAEELYNLARCSARNIEGFLDEMLAEVEHLSSDVYYVVVSEQLGRWPKGTTISIRELESAGDGSASNVQRLLNLGAMRPATQREVEAARRQPR